LDGEGWKVGFTSLVSRQVILDKVSEVGLSLPDSCWGPQVPTKKDLEMMRHVFSCEGKGGSW